MMTFFQESFLGPVILIKSFVVFGFKMGMNKL